MGREGVLLMGFGGPSSLAEVPQFCASLMGREPSADVIERVQLRYLVIGGGSPLPEIANDIARKLGERLSDRGRDVPVVVGMRYWNPFIRDSLRALVDGGVDRVVTVSLSPFESVHSAGAYRKAVVEAATEFPDLAIVEAPSFRDQPLFVRALASGTAEAAAALGGVRYGIVFTAHSLPVADLGDDPYVQELRETAANVVSECGLRPAVEDGGQTWLAGVDAFGSSQADVPWLLAYQSRGQRPGEWLGPDVLDVVRAMSEQGFEGVAFAPIGFATDHMETLYDLDVEACGLAFDLEMDYRRATVPNDSDDLIEALGAIVEPLLRR